jgi:Tfp pilus assembly protein PilZ
VTHQHFALDTDLIVSLDLSNVNRMAQLWGKVKWVEKRQSMGLYDLGVEFVDSPDPVEDITKRFQRG